MIEVTRLNKQKFVLNADYIETIESTPDTIITLYNGKKIIVVEPINEVVSRVMEYKKIIGKQLTIIRREEKEE